MTLFILQPVQQLWETALRDSKLAILQETRGLAELSESIQRRRVFLHGPGGSGKTYCMTEVVMKVVRQFFGERGVKAIAAANAAARLLRGKTMHAAGKMTRNQSLKAKQLKPNSRAKKALQAEWEFLVLLLGDEVSQASPPLLAGISRRASYGRQSEYRLDMKCALEEPFGKVLLQVLMGDFVQLNPVNSHTLLEALVKGIRVPGTPRSFKSEDEDGFKVFDQICENVVLFTGTHRFLDKDLPQLLEIMRTPGGAPVPQALRQKIEERIQAGPDDHRLSPDYVQEDVRGFFAHGAKAAIQWEQVAREQQLHVVTSAQSCDGPRAKCNLDNGKPDLSHHGMFSSRGGQLVYYFQAVDRFPHKDYHRDAYIQALKFVNQSKSANMQGMPGFYIGMRVRLTKKILQPVLVQEATGEIVGIVFHRDERFGYPGVSNLRPPNEHECWERGWVRCDYLPQYIEVRFDGISEDYTGLGKPGVWHVEPNEDTWHCPQDKIFTVGNPQNAGAKRVKVIGKKRKNTVAIKRTALPLSPELVVTYQNVQGGTIRGPEGQAKGFVLDLFRPMSMQGDLKDAEYFQHVYMGMGRPRKLEWMLLRNFPRDKDGALDWSIFENGPPDYLVKFEAELKKRNARTEAGLLRAQQELGMPPFENLPTPPEDPENEGRYVYAGSCVGFSWLGHD